MSQAEQREEAIFEAALNLTTDERPAYLEQACGGDSGLRRRVEVLLGAFERAGGFMKEPVAEADVRNLREQMRSTGTTDATVVTEKPGNRIGRYKLLEQIGEG